VLFRSPNQLHGEDLSRRRYLVPAKSRHGRVRLPGKEGDLLLHGPHRTRHPRDSVQGAHLCTGTHDVEDADFQLVTKPIVIGANAWIAAEAFVGPGVTVGEGAVLGARAVAFRHLDAWTVYAGNPARKLRRRFEQDKPVVLPARLSS
jgi:hypothetical protein